MFTARQYVRAGSLKEAYELNQKKRNLIVGGMIWTRMQHSTYDTLIDISGLGLDTIEETEDAFVIGAMVPLSRIEKDPGLASYTNGAMAESVKHIVGTQFRNLATVGGSLYGRFGFSDVLTMFLALDAEVELFGAGKMPLSEFAKMPRTTRDLLVRVIVPKKMKHIVYLSQRNISTDFPVLTCAAAEGPSGYRCAVGARPQPAALLEDVEGILKNGVTEESAEAFAKVCAEHFVFGSNTRASAGYRKKICSVLVRRALLAGKEV